MYQNGIYLHLIGCLLFGIIASLSPEVPFILGRLVKKWMLPFKENVTEASFYGESWLQGQAVLS